MQKFIDENTIIWFDGKYNRYKDFSVPTLTHALSYPTSVFEGIRSFNGKVFELDEHLERLSRSCKIMCWDIVIDKTMITSVIHDLLMKNNLNDAYIKLLVFLDDGSAGYIGKGCIPKLLIACWEFTDPFAGSVCIEIAKYTKPSNHSFPYQLKGSAGYLQSYLGFKMKSVDVDDVLFVDDSGLICECTGSNIFIKLNGCWITPEPIHCLDGITARYIKDTISKELGIAVNHGQIPLNELKNAEAAFLCGTAVGLVPVKSIKNYIDFSSIDGDIFKMKFLYKKHTTGEEN